MEPSWTDVAVAFGSVVTPIAVVGVGLLVARLQSRNEQLQALRIEYYKDLAPQLNSLLSYIVMIGSWRDQSPPEIVQLKRELDSRFYVAAPLFSVQVTTSYQGFMTGCFDTFGDWGADARIKSSPYHRRRSWRRDDQEWQRGWDEMFTLGETDVVSSEDQTAHGRRYDELISALVRELQLTKSRPAYTTSRVALNAVNPTSRLDRRI